MSAGRARAGYSGVTDWRAWNPTREDYYACARLSGAPVPTGTVVARGLGGEGIGTILAGLFGTGNGTTSYGENIGALSITRVGSRVVVQTGAVIIILVSLIGKFGAVFATMPEPMVSGLYTCLFGLIVSVGISNLQYTNMNCPRNLFIVGFSIFNSQAIAGPGGYFASQETNPFQTGSSEFDSILLSIFSTPMIIAFLTAFFLDNTVKGSKEDRGLTAWEAAKSAKIVFDEEFKSVYNLPFGMNAWFKDFAWLVWIETGEWPTPPSDEPLPVTESKKSAVLDPVPSPAPKDLDDV